MKVQAIVPMAGSGERMKSSTPKPLITIKNKPLFLYTLEALAKSTRIHSIIVAVQASWVRKIQTIIAKANLGKIIHVTQGGKSRRESVFMALKCTDIDTDLVCVHDGARPLVRIQRIDQAIKECEKYKAVVVAVPVKSTIKEADPKTLKVLRSLDRGRLWEIQTPQVFDRELLFKAHQSNKTKNATDDAFLVELLKKPVKIIAGDYSNIKITTPEDLKVAEFLLKGRP